MPSFGDEQLCPIWSGEDPFGLGVHGGISLAEMIKVFCFPKQNNCIQNRAIDGFRKAPNSNGNHCYSGVNHFTGAIELIRVIFSAEVTTLFQSSFQSIECFAMKFCVQSICKLLSMILFVSFSSLLFLVTKP